MTYSWISYCPHRFGIFNSHVHKSAFRISMHGVMGGHCPQILLVITVLGT